jgi:hypothetical protein
MQIRDRVKELRRVPARLLRPHPYNWRTHPADQQDALRGVLAEIGYADALLAREMADGSLQLIDGHLRAETTPEMEVPVLIVDLDDGEAAKLLALHDSLTTMAETNPDAVAGLLTQIETHSPAIQSVLDRMSGHCPPPPDDEPSPEPPEEVPVPEVYQILIDCDDESHQQLLYDRLTADGLKCRLLNL